VSTGSFCHLALQAVFVANKYYAVLLKQITGYHKTHFEKINIA